MKRLTAFGFVLVATLGLFAQERRPQIGDTGPGGGMIYYWDEEEDVYWECSGDLGEATWGQARIDARNYRGGDFDDWCLPSCDALRAMYYNLKLNGIGDIANKLYWEEHEYTSSNAYVFDFRRGTNPTQKKTTRQLFRAVRSFKWEPSE